MRVLDVRYVVLLVLPGLSLFCGCHALTRNAEGVDYRPGGPTITTVATFDASYSLAAPDAFKSWIQTDVPQGSLVGFRQEPDGAVVAFAGELTWPVDDAAGRHVWLCTPKPTNEWERFLVRTRDRSEEAFYKTVMILTAPIWITQCSITGEWP